MSDENAYKQITEEFAIVVRQFAPERMGGLPRQPESPIERAFLIGLMGMSYWVPVYDFGDAFSKQIGIATDNLPKIQVELQAPVEGYRADFLLTVRVGGELKGKVVVECDGHNFHERTKEQAARDRLRDRTMTLAGYKVMRFTGSEIHRDLVGCVTQAHYAAWHYFSEGDRDR